jgi:hypothetical protein
VREPPGEARDEVRCRRQDPSRTALALEWARTGFELGGVGRAVVGVASGERQPGTLGGGRRPAQA